MSPPGWRPQSEALNHIKKVLSAILYSYTYYYTYYHYYYHQQQQQQQQWQQQQQQQQQQQWRPSSEALKHTIDPTYYTIPYHTLLYSIYYNILYYTILVYTILQSTITIVQCCTIYITVQCSIIQYSNSRASLVGGRSNIQHRVSVIQAVVCVPSQVSPGGGAVLAPSARGDLS